ncbi:MAG: hypothetical protein SWH54_16430 [Thermodesulfobacteriota bacterium]|nr:hypothetical protein [Thermodesulfobacteriota bacterium]
MRKAVQLSLFKLPTLNTVVEMKGVLNRGAKNSGMSRSAIADKMNKLAERYGLSLVTGNGNRLTLDTFEKWLNPAEPGRQMPMRVLPVFCIIVGDFSPLEVLARPVGAKVIGEEDQKLLKWAKAYQQVRKGRQEMRMLEPDI